MNDTAIIDVLRTTAFFEGIDDEHLQRLAAITRVVEIPAGQELFHERDAAKEVYFLLSGSVAVVVCLPKIGCRELVDVGAGEMLALSPLVGRTRLLDSARTKKPTRALAIDGEQALGFCREYPEFGFEFMHRVAKGLANRLSATRLQFMELAGFHLPEVQLESD